MSSLVLCQLEQHFVLHHPHPSAATWEKREREAGASSGSSLAAGVERGKVHRGDQEHRGRNPIPPDAPRVGGDRKPPAVLLGDRKALNSTANKGVRCCYTPPGAFRGHKAPSPGCVRIGGGWRAGGERAAIPPSLLPSLPKTPRCQQHLPVPPEPERGG